MKNVRDCINAEFWPGFSNPQSDLYQIGDLESDCVVGESCINLCTNLDSAHAAMVELCARMQKVLEVKAVDGAELDSQFVDEVKQAVYEQCRVWYFG